jgi:hypothetical protein
MSISRERFGQLSEGLLFQSETDAPITIYELPPEKSKQWPPSTGGQFLQLIGEAESTPVEKLSPEKFFRDLLPGNEDHQGQVAEFRKYLTEELKDLEGFRVGAIQIKIFVLGKDDSGKVVGLQTLSVET